MFLPNRVNTDMPAGIFVTCNTSFVVIINDKHGDAVPTLLHQFWRNTVSAGFVTFHCTYFPAIDIGYVTVPDPVEIEYQFFPFPAFGQLKIGTQPDGAIKSIVADSFP